jgi:hypothetical protein
MTWNFLRGPLNQHLELIRLAGAITMPVYLGFIGVHLWRDHAFNAIEAGTGIGLVFAAIGAGSAAKDIGSAKAAATTLQGTGQ